MNQTDYLQRMGITPWRWRDRVVEVPLLQFQQVYVFSLQQPGGEVALLLADADAVDDAELNLVQAMAAATKREAVGGLQTTWQIAPAALPPVLIALGARVASVLRGATSSVAALRGQRHALPGSRHLIISHSPAALLQDRSLKAQAWSDIKLAMEVMA